jgi:hypothetical protein
MQSLTPFLGWSVLAAGLWFAVLQPLAHERELRELAQARANEAASAEMERQVAALAAEFEAALREGAAESARERELSAVTDPELRTELETLRAWPSRMGLVERPALEAEARAAVAAKRCGPYVSERWRLERYRSGAERGGPEERDHAWALLVTEQYLLDFETALACAQRGSFWILRSEEWFAHHSSLQQRFPRTWFETWPCRSGEESCCVVFYAPYELVPAMADLRQRKQKFQEPQARSLMSRSMNQG